MIYKLFPILFLTILLNGCSNVNDFGGFFNSYSTPGERFDSKDSLPLHSDVTTLQNISPSDGKLNYSFTVISDLHVENNNPSHLQEFIDYLDPEDKFILDCGDTTQNGSTEQFTAYKNTMNGSNIAWFQSIGNHDLYFEGWKNYKSIIGRSIYSFNVGNNSDKGSMFVISIDSANSTLGKKQMNWLENELREQSGLWSHIIVFTHSQFFSTGINTVVQFSDTEEIYKLMYLFKKYDVDFVFMGHNHSWDYRTLNGVQYITLDPLKKKGSDDSYVRVIVDGENISFKRNIID